MPISAAVIIILNAKVKRLLIQRDALEIAQL